MKQMTFIQAVREYLTLPGEPLSALRDQLSKLTDKDKEDLKKDFVAIGVEVTAPATS